MFKESTLSKADLDEEKLVEELIEKWWEMRAVYIAKHGNTPEARRVASKAGRRIAGMFL